VDCDKACEGQRLLELNSAINKSFSVLATKGRSMQVSKIQFACLLGFLACISQGFGQDSKPLRTFTQLQKELDAIKAPVVKSIPWETDARAAYAKAVSKHCPLVILFTNAPGPDAGELSEKTLRELEADGLKEFQGKVVFLNVQMSKTSDPRTDYGAEMAQFLKLKEVAHLVFLAPNPTKFSEAFYMEGYFSVADIKADMAKAIPLALQPSLTWAQPSPAALVAQLNEAQKSGDPLKYAACYADPLRTAMAQLMVTKMRVGDAKRRLLDAIDKKFGPQTDRLSFVEDDDSMMDELRANTDVTIIEATTKEGKVTLRLMVTKLQRSGEIAKFEPTMGCIEEFNGWRLVPEMLQESVDAAVNKKAALKELPADFDKITELLAKGQYKAADEARLAAELIYYVRIAADAADVKSASQPQPK
jgi:hypothetical protein